MTANISRTPNHFHVAHGNGTAGWYFGRLHSVVPMNLTGKHPYLSLRYTEGVRVDLDPVDAIATARQITEAIAQLGSVPDCSGSFTDLDGEA